MTNYLIKHTTHTTGETFTDVTKIRDNETYQVIEAESMSELKFKLEMENFGEKMKYYSKQLGKLGRKLHEIKRKDSE
ncbi:DUF1381 domain-containing protein [Staphylococcus xylosus]|uniref:DUF1381 domain-containing protein n=1 Tax=Staphylococcus xylosus TaxID=1288 RepID=UPI002DB977FF|nr:DUF1381 domain-containing protein [Staphylococcus xylosus]MEB8150488.1 DUF1381 domain-containing protein [Staphylococcus xylosus]